MLFSLTHRRSGRDIAAAAFAARTVRAAAIAAAAILPLLSTAPMNPAAAVPPLFSQYTVTDLGVLPGGDTSAGRALASKNTVAGVSTNADGHNEAFVWVSGTMFDLGTLAGHTDSMANGVVDLGPFPLVVGWSYTPVLGSGGYSGRAFMNFFGLMLDMGTLGGEDSRASGVTGQGFIVGDSEITPGSSVTHAFRTKPYSIINPATDDLGTLPGAVSSFGLAVNNRAQVTGQSGGQAYRTKPFSKIAAGDGLGTLGGTFSIGFAINDAGDVAGESTLAAISPITRKPLSRAFMYDAAGLHNLGTLAGYENSLAAGINNKQEVVGFCANYEGFDSGSTEMRAFLWTKANGMQDLNTLIPSLSGWQLRVAAAIDARGRITGVGLRGGKQHAYLLTPKKTMLIPVKFPPDTDF